MPEKIPRPPEVKKLCALRDKDFKSNVKSAKKRKQALQNKKKKVSDPTKQTIRILEGNQASGIVSSIPCNFCSSGILTNHVCHHPGGNRKIEDDKGNLICGLPTCIKCSDGNEDRTRCRKHAIPICLPCDNNLQHKNNQEEVDINDDKDAIPTFTPDYFSVYTSVKALGLDSKSNPFPGFQLLEKWVEKDVEKFSKNTMKNFISFKKKDGRRIEDKVMKGSGRSNQHRSGKKIIN